MVKLASTSIAVILAALSLGQNGPIQLGDAKPVDIHVSAVDWDPNGQALIYTRDEEASKSVGAFGLGKFDGKTLLKLQKDDTYDVYWLANSNSALLVVHGAVPQAKTKSTEIRIYTLDADLQKIRKDFDETYEDKFVPSVDVDTSPLLKHAIVTLRREAEYRHMVIAPNGDLINAPDLDRAEKDGLSGPSWSIDGTAIYSNLPNTNKINTGLDYVVSKTTTNNSNTGRGNSDSTTNGAVTLGEDQAIYFTSIIGREKLAGTFRILFKLAPPTPPTGSNVLELMPSNAALRPVRFRGPWVEKHEEYTPLAPYNQPIVLQYDRSNAQDSSVWIKRGKEKGNPATLLGVHVSDSWLSPTESAVAYVIDGALFVRPIK